MLDLDAIQKRAEEALGKSISGEFISNTVLELSNKLIELRAKNEQRIQDKLEQKSPEEAKEILEKVFNQEGLNGLESLISAVPNEEKYKLVYDNVVKFFNEQHVSCYESIHQCDWVIIAAYDFLTDLFSLVESDLNIERDEA